MQENQTSLKNKIFTLLMGISMFLGLVLGLVLFLVVQLLRINIVSHQETTGYEIAAYSESMFEEIVSTHILTLVENSAALANEIIIGVRDKLYLVANSATDLTQNKHNFNPNLPGENHTWDEGDYTAQLLLAPDVGNAFIRSADEDMTSIIDMVGLYGNIQNTLKSIVSISDIITAAYIGTETGISIIVDKYNSSDPEIEFDPRQRPWYILAKENKDISWTDIYLDAFLDKYTITCAMPFYDEEGNVIGVAGIDIFLDEFQEILKNTKVGESGFAFLMDNNGETIDVGNGFTAEASGNVGNGFIRSASGNKINIPSASRVTISNQEYFVAVAPLEALPWYLVSVIQVEEVVAPAVFLRNTIISRIDDTLHRVKQLMLASFLFFVLFAICITLVIRKVGGAFAAKLTNSLTDLETVASQIAEGNFDVNIEINTGDEIERLGKAINKMASDLKLAIDRIAKESAEKERISSELNIANQIQKSMLPCIFPAFPERDEIDIYAFMYPAKEVGGDFYDFYLLDKNTIAVVIADVSGKGIAAALFMVIARTLIKNVAQLGKNPKEVLETVNNILNENNEAFMFVTCILGYIDLTTGKFIYVNAGHNPPVIARGKEIHTLSGSGGFVLAVCENMIYTINEIVLQPDDLLFLYTDGVTEAFNSLGEQFGEKRMLEIVDRFAKLPVKEFLISIKQEVDNFSAGEEQSDDITMLALRFRTIDN